jgi:hypothetical protein
MPMLYRWLVVTVAMAMAAVIVVLVVPVGLSMAVIAIFVAPVSFVEAPTIRVVVVMRMRPGCAWVGWLLVASRNPTIVVPVRRPETAHPDHPGCRRWRWGRLIRYRRWGNSHIHRNLGRCGRRKGHAKKKRDQTSVFHAGPPSDVEPVPADQWKLRAGKTLLVRTLQT